MSSLKATASRQEEEPEEKRNGVLLEEKEVSPGEAPNLQRIEIGHKYSRYSAQAYCKKHGGRLPYRHEFVKDERLLVNDGNAYGGDKWIPVADGNDASDPESLYFAYTLLWYFLYWY